MFHSNTNRIDEKTLNTRLGNLEHLQKPLHKSLSRLLLGCLMLAIFCMEYRLLWLRTA